MALLQWETGIQGTEQITEKQKQVDPICRKGLRLSARDSDRQTATGPGGGVTSDDMFPFLDLQLPSRKEANIDSSTQQGPDRPERKQKGINLSLAGAPLPPG